MTSLHAPYLNETIDERYLILRKIADGGMATVYEATDQRLHRRVAVKIMHSSLVSSDHRNQYVQRFHREAQAAAHIENPHIVHIYDVGEINGVGYLVMEYVDGHTLRELMYTQSPFNVRNTLTIISQVLDGLSAAHDLDIIHRDIKPENIMINSRGNVQIADFGLAKHINNATLTPTGTLLGTATYIPPETAMDNTSVIASDLYSTGLVMWEMLTGRPAFETNNPVTVVYKHVHENVPRLVDLFPRIPKSVSDFVSHLTEREPSRRPPNAGVALKELHALSNSLSESQLEVQVSRSDIPHPRIHTAPDVSSKILSGKDSRTQSILDDATPARMQRFKKIRTWIASYQTTVAVTAIVMLILIIVGTVMWWDSYGPGSYISLPAASDISCQDTSQCTVQGADATQYKKLLTSRGLKYVVTYSHSDTVKSGKIISTTPSRVGSHISKKSAQVTMVISTGIQEITIPSDITDPDSVHGKNPIKTLKDLGFTRISHSDSEDIYSTEVPKGSVISIEPKAGRTVAHNQKITVVLSKGLKEVTMPDLTGMTRAEAIDTLNKLKLKATYKDDFSDSVPAGSVVKQSENSGTKLHWNDKVTITISQGPQTVTIPDVRGKSIARAQTMLEDLGLRVVINNKGGSDVMRQSISPGEIVSVMTGGKKTNITLTTTTQKPADLDDEDD
ncbi:PASTA domain-containing protein [Alloscardovia venturai]|uniref:non-specific serine/threonine protein kinase n=1 Tax=Alloscardovia venturai TaxID=1769421 RepID=A0ABW2Y8J0_9BIFI